MSQEVIIKGTIMAAGSPGSPDNTLPTPPGGIATPPIHYPPFAPMPPIFVPPGNRPSLPIFYPGEPTNPIQLPPAIAVPPIAPPGSIDNTLPTPPPGGSIDNTLPGRPTTPPDNTLPATPPHVSLPIHLVGYVLMWSPTFGWVYVPLGKCDCAHVDNTLPTPPGRVDNTLPPTAQPKK